MRENVGQCGEELHGLWIAMPAQAGIALRSGDNEERSDPRLRGVTMNVHRDGIPVSTVMSFAIACGCSGGWITPAMRACGSSTAIAAE